MAKRKTKKTKGFLWFKSKAKKKPARKTKAKVGLSPAVKVAVVALILVVVAGMAVGFKYLEGYVHSHVRYENDRKYELILVDKPLWVNHGLQQKIFSVARLGDQDIILDENAAQRVADNLINNMEWLDPQSIRVETTSDSIRIIAKYREPVAYVEYRSRKYYLDTDLHVLGYLPITELNTIEIVNYKHIVAPKLGQVWRQDDLNAGVKLTAMLRAVDDKRQQRGTQTLLLPEIDSVDVTYFGQRSPKKSQLTLNVKDGVKIFWGAEPGKASANLEASEEDKLMRLYGQLDELGSLRDKIKYVDLRNPHNEEPLR